MEVDGEPEKFAKCAGGQVCQICGDDVGTTVDVDLFIGCDVRGFSVCRLCYEYERKQSCLQCKTKYKRHKGFKMELTSFSTEEVMALKLRRVSNSMLGRRESWDVANLLLLKRKRNLQVEEVHTR